MPFYEYECENCKFYTEVLQKISDAPLRKCPSCGKNALKKLVSAPVFRLKGAGWYETDFKSDKENKRNLAVDQEPPASAAPSTSNGSKDRASPETKASDAKPVESKTSESKASDSKPAAETKSAGSAAGSGSGSSRAASRASSRVRRPAAKAKSKPAAAKRKRR